MCFGEVRRINPQFPSEFLSYEQLFSHLWDWNNFRQRVIVSLWRWMMNGQYILESKVDRKSKDFNRILFEELNQSILVRKWEEKIDWLLHFAIVVWFEPWEMIQYLEKHQDLFDWIKIPAFTPIAVDDPKFQPLWDFCKMKKWPVLVHCSRNIKSKLNFNAVLNLVSSQKDLVVTASHMWGDNVEIFGNLVLAWFKNWTHFKDNLFLNTAVTNIELISLAIKQWLSDHLVYASDVPFHGSCSHLKRVAEAVWNDRVMEKILLENWLRSLNRKS